MNLTNLSMLEKCYFAACESDTSAQNYLRALLNGYGSGTKREELQKLFGAFPVYKGGGSYTWYEGNHFQYGIDTYFEREENRPDRNMILLLRFLDGQFADVLDKGLNKSEALGWTGTFMKQGIALYLLYLYEGKWAKTICFFNCFHNGSLWCKWNLVLEAMQYKELQLC